jgi:hypothetical protein
MAQARAQVKQAEPELDLNHLAGLIRAGRAAPELMESWLDTTWREPARFRRSLYRAAAARGSETIKSRPELGLDLYADCIASHLGHQRPALTIVQEGRGPQEISYETLHARSAALASLWVKSGVKAGESLALLLPVGLDYAVALLAALRLGLAVTPIPPLGASYARHRLLLTAADHVATSARLTHMLPPESAPSLPLTAAGVDGMRAASHAYAPTDCVLRLLSPFGPCDALTELDAVTLHESLLRDGLLVMALTTADRVAAPGWDVLQLQPLLLLTTWLVGATWVECTAADFAAQSLGISVLGVDTRLRELIRARGDESCRGVKSWFRSLSDRIDHDKWRTFSELLGARGITQFSVLYNAASGGAQLFSPRATQDLIGRMWPAPGRTFIISQVGSDLLPALDATGVYTPLRDEEADPSLVRLVIAKLDHGWTSGGSIDVGPEARTMPAREIAACAGRDPRVGAASLVVLAGRWPNEAHVLLLVFVSEPEAVSGELAADLRALIAHELGEQHVPERIEISPLHPRRDDDGIRADWCVSQYQSGMLGRKARVPMFLTLSRLAWIFQPPTS